MNRKLAIVMAVILSLLECGVDAQTNVLPGKMQTTAPRVWTFQTGMTISGDYYSSGTEMVVIKHDGTNCFLRIADISPKDQAYVAENQFKQRQALLASETNEMLNTGMVEFTVQQSKNFPEKTKVNCWMDAEFEEINSDELLDLTRDSEADAREIAAIAGEQADNMDFRDDFLGVHVADKNGDSFNYCFASKKPPMVDDLMKLHKGDRVRLWGYVDNFGGGFGGDEYQLWFQIYRIEIIETVAEKKARENADNGN